MPGQQLLTPKFELKVGGSPFPPEAVAAVIVIRARQDLDMADLLEVKLTNDESRWSEDDTFKEGKLLSFSAGFEDGPALGVLVTGEIVRRECEFPVRGPATVTLVALDKRHRLKRGAKSRTFLNQKDSQVASTIAGEVGLTAEVDDSGTVHPFLFQNAQSDLSFLRERAALIGYELRVDRTGSKLVFKKAATSGGNLATLTWGQNLHSFTARIATEEQVSKVEVRGWRMETKQKVTGAAQASAITVHKLDGTQLGSAVAQAKYSTREVLVTDLPCDVTGEAEARAKARMEGYAAKFCEATASCVGNPTLEPGKKLEIKGCGKRVNGAYYVTSVLHYYEPRIGYTTHCDMVRSSQTTATPPPPALPPPLKPRETEYPPPENYVEFKVVADTGESLEGMNYTVTTSDGRTESGTFDSSQKVKVQGLRDKGDAKVEVHPPDDITPVGGGGAQ